MTLADVLRECSRLRIELASNGERLRYSNPELVSGELARGLVTHKLGILSLLRRAGGLKQCRNCGGRLYMVPTIDGFANLECFQCGDCAGCLPATEAAIKKYGNG